MFGLFNKGGLDYKTAIVLMKKVFERMEGYESIRKQLDEGIVNGVQNVSQPIPNYIKFNYNTDVLNKFEDKQGRYFAIKGIKIFDNKSKKNIELQINVGFGILLGFAGIGQKITEPDLNSIQIQGYKIQNFGESDYDKIKNLLTADEQAVINPDDVYQLDLKGKSYYHLFDTEDGDFIGIDSEKNIYKISHDPFEIKELADSLVNIFKLKQY